MTHKQFHKRKIAKKVERQMRDWTRNDFHKNPENYELILDFSKSEKEKK